MRNAYLGSREGDASVSDYVRSKNNAADKKVRDAIDAAIVAIERIPEPFAKNAAGALSEAAMKAAGDTLVSALEEADAVITDR